jgi:tartrate-resistant acid phosphatase type 5
MRLDGLSRSRRALLKAGFGGALVWPLIGWKSVQAATGAPPFVVVGDWCRDGECSQRDVALQMGKTAASIGSRFTISVGDNFYEDGVVSMDDPHWRTSFEEVYAAPSLQTPWYPVFGNHDYRGNPDAQIAYSRTSASWRMPARYYKRTEALADGGQPDFFHLDTSPFLAAYRRTIRYSQEARTTATSPS